MFVEPQQYKIINSEGLNDYYKHDIDKVLLYNYNVEESSTEVIKYAD